MILSSFIFLNRLIGNLSIAEQKFKKTPPQNRKKFKKKFRSHKNGMWNLRFLLKPSTATQKGRDWSTRGKYSNHHQHYRCLKTEIFF